MAYYTKGIMVKDVDSLIELWDFEKNKKIGLNPNLITFTSREKAYWKCKNGHSWKEEIYYVFKRKNKCYYCSGRLVWTGYNDLKTLYPKLAEEFDEEKNKISADKISPRDTKTYWWKCKYGHPSFPRSVSHRIERNDTCPYCTKRKVIPGVNDLQTLFPDIAAEFDKDRNKGVLPSEISPDSWKSYNWICPKGHHYSMKVHLRTHSIKSIDCPKCIKAHSTSFPEQAIYYYAKQFYPDAINRYKGLSKTGLELDIFIPSWSVGIEYDGMAFHSSKEAKDREKRKYQLCKQNNIKLIRVKEGTSVDWFNEAADKVYHVKKRPNDNEINNFLVGFFEELTKWSHKHYAFYINPITKKREMYFCLPVDINIKRDRPKILEYLVDVKNSFGALYPNIAKYWDKDKNGNLTPYMFLPGSNYVAWFKCSRCGRSWSSTIAIAKKWNRTLCKKCSMGDNGKNWTRRSIKERGSLGEIIPESLKQWDKDNNGKLTPFDIPINYSKKVNWKCPKCNYKWSASPNSRIRNNKLSSCPHCSGRVPLIGVDDFETLYPEIAKQRDYERNKGYLPSQFRAHSPKVFYWICPKHKISYKASICSRANGTGCKLCGIEKTRDKVALKVEQYTKDLKIIKTYASINEAARILNVSAESIRQAVLRGWISHNSYWKYVGTSFGNLKPDRKTPVIGINIKTGEKVEFGSAREAARTIPHTWDTGILRCCRKLPSYKTCGGYKWEFKKK